MFEKLSTIEGLNEAQINQIKTVLSPEIENEVKLSHKNTFSAIDSFAEEFTGVKKQDGQKSSEYVRNALSLWKDSYEQDLKKKISSEWESEKQKYNEQLAKAKDSDKIFADYQAVTKANDELKKSYEQKLQDVKNQYEGAIKIKTIESQLPVELNDPILLPWREKVSQMLADANVSIENGKILASEATLGLNVDIKQFIIDQIPALKSVFEKNTGVGGETGKQNTNVPVTGARTVNELHTLLRDKVMQEHNINFGSSKFPELFKKELDAHRAEIERLKRS